MAGEVGRRGGASGCLFVLDVLFQTQPNPTGNTVFVCAPAARRQNCVWLNVPRAVRAGTHRLNLAALASGSCTVTSAPCGVCERRSLDQAFAAYVSKPTGRFNHRSHHRFYRKWGRKEKCQLYTTWKGKVPSEDVDRPFFVNKLRQTSCI